MRPHTTAYVSHPCSLHLLLMYVCVTVVTHQVFGAGVGLVQRLHAPPHSRPRRRLRRRVVDAWQRLAVAVPQRRLGQHVAPPPVLLVLEACSSRNRVSVCAGVHRHKFVRYFAVKVLLCETWLRQHVAPPPVLRIFGACSRGSSSSVHAHVQLRQLSASLVLAVAQERCLILPVWAYIAVTCTQRCASKAPNGKRHCRRAQPIREDRSSSYQGGRPECRCQRRASCVPQHMHMRAITRPLSAMNVLTCKSQARLSLLAPSQTHARAASRVEVF
jgi:hypothetical protein